jgi:hypothetical protein
VPLGGTGEHGTGPPLLLLLDTPLELPLLPPPELLPLTPEELPLTPELLPLLPLLPPPEELLLPPLPLLLDPPPDPPLLPPGPPSPTYSIARPPQPALTRAALIAKPRKVTTGEREVRTTAVKSERRANAHAARFARRAIAPGVSR